MDFSRPVTIDGQEHEASFRTVRLKPDFFGGGRIYFCHHLTPELVWRPEWLNHPNGFRAIERIEVESPRRPGDGGALSPRPSRARSRAVPRPDPRRSASCWRIARFISMTAHGTGCAPRASSSTRSRGCLDRAAAAGIAATGTVPGQVTLDLPDLETTAALQGRRMTGSLNLGDFPRPVGRSRPARSSSSPPAGTHAPDHHAVGVRRALQRCRAGPACAGHRAGRAASPSCRRTVSINVAAFMGAMRAGIVPAPVNQKLPRATATQVVADSGARLVLFRRRARNRA